ncbi:MAG TPA: hypothetical protein PLD23_04115 [Armatimonadota bacterium]|nr:hypothetical protein [Armatimonadota bacterium]HQK92661.1 hypothetical protein [Armatimonadota bacterium]
MLVLSALFAMGVGGLRSATWADDDDTDRRPVVRGGGFYRSGEGAGVRDRATGRVYAPRGYYRSESWYRGGDRHRSRHHDDDVVIRYVHPYPRWRYSPGYWGHWPYRSHWYGGLSLGYHGRHGHFGLTLGWP